MIRQRSFISTLFLLALLAFLPSALCGNLEYLKNLRDARISAEHKEWERAIESYNRALSEDPFGIEALRELASIHLSQRSDPGSACPLVERLKQVIPDDPNVQWLASICSSKPHRQKAESEPAKDVRIEAPSEKIPSVPSAAAQMYRLYAAANVLYSEQNFDAALQTVEKALQSDSGDISCLILKIRILISMERHGEASDLLAQIESGELGRVIMPQQMLELSIVYDVLGNASQAFAMIKQSLVGSFKGSAVPFLINFSERHSEMKEAKELLYSTLKSCDTCFDPLWGEAQAAVEKRNLYKAVYFLEFLTKVEPPDPTVFFWLGQYHAQLKNPDGTIENYEKWLKLADDTRDVSVYYNLGYSYYTKKDYPRSASYYEKAIKLEPGLAEAYMNLGMAYIGMKEWEKAKPVLKKSLQLKPSLYDAYYNLYLVAHGMGDTQAAMWYLQRFNQERSRATRPSEQQNN